MEASIYRSPSSPPDNKSKLNSFMRTIGSIRTRYIVNSDMIFYDIDGKCSSTNHDEYSKEHQLLEAAKDSYLDQIIDSSTRVTNHDEPSLLDLLLTD